MSETLREVIARALCAHDNVWNADVIFSDRIFVSDWVIAADAYRAQADVIITALREWEPSEEQQMIFLTPFRALLDAAIKEGRDNG